MPSAVSQQVLNLDASLGIELDDSSVRKVVNQMERHLKGMTPLFGKEELTLARKNLSEFANIMNDIDDEAEKRQEEIADLQKLTDGKHLMNEQKALEALEEQKEEARYLADTQARSVEERLKAEEDILELEQKITRQSHLVAALEGTTAGKRMKELQALENKAKQDRANTEKDFKKQMDKDKERAKRRIDDLKKYTEFEKAMKRQQEHIESGTGVLEAIKNRDAGKAAGGISGLGKKLQVGHAAATETGTAGVLSKVLGGLGKALQTIGALIGPVLALGAGLFMVVKMLLDADAKVKDFNKGLFDAGMSVQDFADKTGKLDKGLDLLYDAFAGTALLGFRMELGLTTEDMQKMQGAFSQTGVSLKKLTEGAADETQALEMLQNQYRTTTLFARGFGVTLDAMATTMGLWMTDLRMSGDMVHRGLQDIGVAAMDSGFGLKRFYGMVQEITSGMSQYNIRLNETAGLLSSMTKILGPDAGKDFVKNLETAARDMSTMDRLKRNIVQGSKITGMEIKFEASRDIKDLLEKGGNGVKVALQASGMDESMAKAATLSGENLEKALRGMNKGQRSKVLAELDPKFTQQFNRINKEIEAGNSHSAFAQSRALRNQSAASELLSKGFAFMGKAVDTLSDAEFAAAEQQGMADEQTADVFTRLRAEFNKDAKGAKSFQEYVLSYSDKQIEALKKNQPKTLEQLAQEQIEKTTSTQDRMQMFLSGWFARFTHILSSIVSLMPGSGKESGILQQEAAQARIKDIQDNIKNGPGKGRFATQDQINDLTKAFDDLDEGLKNAGGASSLFNILGDGAGKSLRPTYQLAPDTNQRVSPGNTTGGPTGNNGGGTTINNNQTTHVIVPPSQANAMQVANAVQTANSGG